MLTMMVSVFLALLGAAAALSHTITQDATIAIKKVAAEPFKSMGAGTELLTASVKGASGQSLRKPQEKSTDRHEAEISKDAQTSPKEPEQYCAVCFIGQLRSLSDTAERLHTQLLEPLASGGVHVEVFVAAEQGGPFTIDTFGLNRSGPYLYNSQLHIVLRDSTWRRHQTAAEIEYSIEHTAPRSAITHYRNAKGNWIGPMYNHKGNGMRFYRLERDCIDMLKRSENQDDKTYTWVIRTRPDLVWMAPHPPLSLMSLDRVWVLNGEHYWGVNQRHMVGSRDMMVKLLDRQHLIEVGDPVVYEVKGFPSNDECFMEEVARKYGAALGRIEYPAFLVRNPEWVKTGWRPPGEVYSQEENDAKSTGYAASQEHACWQRLLDRLVIKNPCSDEPMSLSLGLRPSSKEAHRLPFQSKSSWHTLLLVLLAVLLFILIVFFALHFLGWENRSP